MRNPWIIASTHVRLPLSERSQLSHIPKELSHFLNRHNMSLITTHHLYELWQKAKGGEINIFGFFEKVYSHSGYTFHQKGQEILTHLYLTFHLNKFLHL